MFPEVFNGGLFAPSYQRSSRVNYKYINDELCVQPWLNLYISFVFIQSYKKPFLAWEIFKTIYF